jgi:hypothetical protein
MRPSGEELLRGVQGTLLTYVLPELQTEYARTELMLAHVLIGIVASEWDTNAQQLIDDNAALRGLCGQGAEALAGEAIADELRALAAGSDSSLRLSELMVSNDELRSAIGRLGVMLQSAPGNAELRAAVIERLRLEAERASRNLMGPRADG